MVGRLTRLEAAAGRNSDTEPKEPPPPATPLSFPSCTPQERRKNSSHDRDNLKDLKLYGNIIRTGPKYDHFNAFNISLANDALLNQLFLEDLLPPKSWLDDPSSLADSKATTRPDSQSRLSNGSTGPGRDTFYKLARELLYDNGDAFCSVRRETPLPGRQPVRPTWARKFWLGLADMAEYWDTSIDKYTESTEENDPKSKDAMDIDELRSEAEKTIGQTNGDAGQARENTSKSKKTYTGRRTSTGRSMPNKFREDTIFALVEMVVGQFGCRLDHARMQPRVHVHGMVFPLPHLGSVYRTPQDPRKARSGLLEGPLIGVYSRDQTRFRGPDQEPGEGQPEIFDLLKETGLLVMTAQKRAREGKEEVLPGTGKWWSTSPRWGGGPGGEFGTSDDEVIEEPVSSNGPRKRTKKVSKAEIWRAMLPPKSTWEKNVTYLQVGKDGASDYEQVSISSQLSIGNDPCLTIQTLASYT